MSKAKNDVMLHEEKNWQFIRVVVFKDCDAWVAQCLEHDICAQADDLTEVTARLKITLAAERDLSLSQGKKPFEGIPPAPKHYFKLWEKGQANKFMVYAFDFEDK